MKKDLIKRHSIHIPKKKGKHIILNSNYIKKDLRLHSHALTTKITSLSVLWQQNVIDMAIKK